MRKATLRDVVRSTGPEEMAHRRTAVQCAVNCDRTAAEAMEKLGNARTHVGAGDLSIASELIHDALGVLLRYKPAHLPTPPETTAEMPVPDQDYSKSQVSVSVGAHGTPMFSFSTERDATNAKVIERITKYLRRPKVDLKVLQKMISSLAFGNTVTR